MSAAFTSPLTIIAWLPGQVPAMPSIISRVESVVAWSSGTFRKWNTVEPEP